MAALQSTPWGKGAEALFTGVGGALLGLAVGWPIGGLVHPAVAVVMAVVGGANGVVSGWRGVYAWRTTDGVLAWLLDSTWAALPTMVGLLAHGVAMRGGGYEASLSVRQNRHVYRGGLYLKRGYALTVGNVISSAGDLGPAGRRTLITDHEAVHVWQARAFGPFYLPLYGLWSAGGAVAGLVLWLRRGRRQPLGKLIETCSYYLNPFEWWAYSRQDYWPPKGKVAGIGWKRPAARPLTAIRAARAGLAAELSAELLSSGPHADGTD